ncbi:VWA domain-containing protein [Candidatus Acetothermia bacterium]|nr:VWA domain-containing protein [Candidatus Acetothermia bacterium]
MRFSRAILTFLVMSLLLGEGACLTQAQSASPSVRIDSIYTNQFPVNRLELDVISASGTLVRGLNEKNFSLSENGVLQPFALTPRRSGSLGIVLIIDSSESMGGWGNAWKIERAKSASAQIIAQLHPGDGATLLEFDEKIRTLVPFTTELHTLLAGLAHVNAGGGTALFDGVLYAIHRASQLKTDQRAIVLISDGYDRNSSAWPEEVLERARKNSVPIFALSFNDVPANGFLQSLVTLTNGTFEVLSSDSSDLQVNAVFAHLANSYEISFTTQNPTRDSSTRSVELNFHSGPFQSKTAVTYLALSMNESKMNSASTSAQTVLELGSAKASPGQILRLPLRVHGVPAPGISAFDLTIDFDPTVLRVAAIERGDSPSSELTAIEVNNVVGRAHVNGRLQSLNDVAEGVLAYVNAEVVGAPSRQSDLLFSQVSLTDSSGQSLSVFAVKGVITVSGSRRGDVNGDGKVDLADAFRIASYAAGFIHALALDLDAADVNQDGVVDFADAWAIILGRADELL